eukprot:TRINITY_DN9203_c0_g1_i1.p1 TRINITY_DN9203_c0_g1~~TRINITY_DN9203_c0_g1_i1.p1  ORF type:complete len:2124 (+),score=299.50 TRINITY_DN9203_c0_g1_i1:120-6491(+)
MNALMLLVGAGIVAILGYSCGKMRVSRELLRSLEYLYRGEEAPGLPEFPACLPSNDQLFTPYRDLEQDLLDGSTDGVMRKRIDLLQPYVTSVWFPTDVELATRFLREYRVFTGQSPTVRTLAFASRIFTKGLVKYRTTDLVQFHFALFLFHFGGRLNLALGLLDRLATGPNVGITTRYHAFKMSVKLKSLMGIRNKSYMKIYSQARQLHKDTLLLMSKFWAKLLVPQVDTLSLALLCNCITEHREKGLREFKRTLAHHSGDRIILMKFALFLEQVMLDPEAAQRVRTEAEELSEVIAVQGSRRSASNLRGGTVADTTIGTGFGAGAGIASYLTRSSHRHSRSSTISTLSFNLYLIFAVLFMLVVGFFVFGKIDGASQQRTIDKMHAAGLIRAISQHAAHTLWEYVLTATSAGLSAASNVHERLQSQLNDFVTNHNQLTYGSATTSYPPHQEFYKRPFIEIRKYLAVNSSVPHLTGLWGLGNLLATALGVILTDPNSPESRVYTDFVLKNSPRPVADAMNRSMQLYQDESLGHAQEGLLGLALLYICSVFIILAVYLIMIFNFKKIGQAKLTTLNLFSLIPLDTLERLHDEEQQRVTDFDIMEQDEDEDQQRVQLMLEEEIATPVSKLPVVGGPIPGVTISGRSSDPDERRSSRFSDKGARDHPDSDDMGSRRGSGRRASSLVPLDVRKLKLDPSTEKAPKPKQPDNLEFILPDVGTDDDSQSTPRAGDTPEQLLETLHRLADVERARTPEESPISVPVEVLSPAAKPATSPSHPRTGEGHTPGHTWETQSNSSASAPVTDEWMYNLKKLEHRYRQESRRKKDGSETASEDDDWMDRFELILQSSVALSGELLVESPCPNRRNPFHQCTHYCLNWGNALLTEMTPDVIFPVPSAKPVHSGADGFSKGPSKPILVKIKRRRRRKRGTAGPMLLDQKSLRWADDIPESKGKQPFLPLLEPPPPVDLQVFAGRGSVASSTEVFEEAADFGEKKREVKKQVRQTRGKLIRALRADRHGLSLFVFWLVLLLFTLSCATLAILVQVRLTLPAVSSKFDNAVNHLTIGPTARDSLDKLVQKAQQFVQFGSWDSYAEYWNLRTQGPLATLQQDLTLSAGTPEEVAIAALAANLDPIENSVLTAMTLAKFAFNISKPMPEIIGHTWPVRQYAIPTLDATLAAGTTTAYMRNPALPLSNRSADLSQAPKQMELLARSVLFSDEFLANVGETRQQIAALNDHVSPRIQSEVEAELGQKRRYLRASLACAIAVFSLALISLLSLRRSAILSHSQLVLELLLLAVLIFSIIAFSLTLVANQELAELGTGFQIESEMIGLWNNSRSTRRQLTAHAEAFTQFGDLVSKYKYTELLGAMPWERFEERLVSLNYVGPGSDPSNMRPLMLIEQSRAALQKVLDVQALALRLAAAARNLSDQLPPEVAVVRWNLAAEAAQLGGDAVTAEFRLRQEYPEQRYWYSSTEHDLGLPSEMQDAIAREALFSRRYSDLSAAVEQPLRQLVNELQESTQNHSRQGLARLSNLVLWACIAAGAAFGSVLLYDVLLGIRLLEFSGTSRDESLNKELFQNLTKQSRVSLFLNACLFSGIFVSGYFNMSQARHIGTDLNRASAREWLVARSLVQAYELVEGSPAAVLPLRESLRRSIKDIQWYRDGLYYDRNSGSGSYGYVLGDHKQTELLFSPSSGPGGASVDLALRRWEDGIDRLLAASDVLVATAATASERLTLLRPLFNRLKSLEPDLSAGLRQSTDLLEAHARSRIHTNQLIFQIMLVLMAVIIIWEFFFIFRPMIAQLRDEEEGTKLLLLLIPKDVRNGVPGIQEYLDTGVIQDAAQLHKNLRESEKLLSNILPPSISKRLKAGERPIADFNKSVTILFTDFVGFTEMSSKMSARNIVVFLNNIFSLFDDVVDELGLEKIKTIGDAYFLVGGLHRKAADHALRVVEAGIHFYDALALHNKRYAETKPLRMRVGVNTGPAVAGVIGERKVAFDLWGDSVNTASRMESNGVPGRIQISQSTYAAVKEYFTVEERTITAKGKGTLTTYLLTGRTFAGEASPYRRSRCMQAIVLSYLAQAAEQPEAQATTDPAAEPPAVNRAQGSHGSRATDSSSQQGGGTVATRKASRTT